MSELKYADKKSKIPYIRVKDDYYKKIKRVTSKGDIFDSLVNMKRQTIIDDHGKDYLKEVPKYDYFCNNPNHRRYRPVIEGNYNMYHKFTHKPKRGDWYWTEVLLRHIFGEQYELGLDYIQLMYQQPTQKLPVLCLVSAANKTGKTTFLDWLVNMFDENAVIIGNQDISGPFNSHFAGKLVIAIDESKIDKLKVMDKLKAMATSKKQMVHTKFVAPYEVDNFCKILMASNREDDFITAHDEDVRFWVRKLGLPAQKNVDIDADLKKEIPAFLHFLDNRTIAHKKETRMWFDESLVYTDALGVLQQNSQETVLKHLKEYLTDAFDGDDGLKEVYATPIDIYDVVFKARGNVDANYIRKLLKKRMKLKPVETTIRYKPLGIMYADDKTGKPFRLTQDDFYVNGNV